MKSKTFQILIPFMIIMLSCEKTEFRKDITGIWTSGIILNGNGGTAEPVNFTDLKITKGYRYYIYNDETLIVSGSYSLSDSDDKNFEPFAIKFESQNGTNINFSFNRDLNIKLSRNSDTLKFSQKLVDGFEYYFIKK